MSAFDISDAVVLSSGQFQARQQDTEQRAAQQSAANEIVEDAHRRAAEIIAQAEARVAEKEQMMAQLAENGLDRFLREDAVDQTARALGQLIDQARQVRAELEDAQSWVLPLLRTALTRIVGRLPDEELLSGVLLQSLGEVRDRWNLVLRCHPALQRPITSVIESDERLRSSIREVQVDRALATDDIRLVSGQGILDIGVSTQIDTFLQAVERYLGDWEDAHRDAG